VRGHVWAWCAKQVKTGVWGAVGVQETLAWQGLSSNVGMPGGSWSAFAFAAAPVDTVVGTVACGRGWACSVDDLYWPLLQIGVPCVYADDHLWVHHKHSQ